MRLDLRGQGQVLGGQRLRPGKIKKQLGGVGRPGEGRRRCGAEEVVLGVVIRCLVVKPSIHASPEQGCWDAARTVSLIRQALLISCVHAVGIQPCFLPPPSAFLFGIPARALFCFSVHTLVGVCARACVYVFLVGHSQLGLEDVSNRGAAALTMGDDLPFVDLGAGESALTVVAANHFTCALLADETVK